MAQNLPMIRNELEPACAAPCPRAQSPCRGSIRAVYGLHGRGSKCLVRKAVIQRRVFAVGRGERGVREKNVAFVGPDGGEGVGDVPLTEELVKRWKRWGSRTVESEQARFFFLAMKSVFFNPQRRCFLLKKS